MGVEVDKPIINKKTLEWNYTNEGGVDGTYRLLKNIMGLWIIQECKKEWDRRGEVYNYDQMAKWHQRLCPLEPLSIRIMTTSIAGDMPKKIKSSAGIQDNRFPNPKIR